MAGEGEGWFGVGFGAGLAPVRVGAGLGGAVRAVRPSWSFVGLVLGGGGGALVGEGRAALPADCRDLLASESHVLLRREAALEGWRVGAGPALDGAPLWRRELRREDDDDGEEEDEAAELPLVPGGYVVPQPDFFRPLSPALRARQLALGHEHTLLLGAGGHLFSWGAGRHGQLGHGDLVSKAEPQLVEALHGVPMSQVAAGGWHSACVGEAGDLYMWGWNESGQLGLPSKGTTGSPGAGPAQADQHSTTPSSGPGAQHGGHPGVFVSIQAFPALLDMPEGEDVRKVSCGSRHTAALTRTGELYTWGWGKYGQLGHRDTATSDRPKKACSFEAWGLEVADVVCGPWATFALVLPGAAEGQDARRSPPV